MLPSLAHLSLVPTSAPQGANKEEWTSKSTDKLIQLLIVLDCTGSMSGPMSAVKRAVLDVVDEMHAKMTQPTIRSDDLSENITVQFSLITYRDYRDRPPCSEPLPFGPPEAVRAAIAEENAKGGDDDPECVELAMHYAETRLQWDERADKMLLLVTDAPPHAQGGVYDDYPNGAPSQYQCPDLWKTVDRLADRGVCITICGCGGFDSLRRTPTIYELMAKRTNGRLVRFDRIQSNLASYLGTAALEEDFVQNVLERVGRLNLSDDAYDAEVQAAMQGMEAMFRSLSSDEYAVDTFFEVDKFDDAKDSDQIRTTFRSLGATSDNDIVIRSAGYRSLVAGDDDDAPALRSLGAGDDDDAPAFRSLGAGDDDDAPMLPPAKVMRSAPPEETHRARVTTRDRLRRRA